MRSTVLLCHTTTLGRERLDDFTLWSPRASLLQSQLSEDGFHWSGSSRRECPAFIGPGSPLAPSITWFSAQVLPGHMAVLSGVVSDSSPSGCSVTFSGAASGSTGCDGSGDFSYTTSSANLGKVFAVARDGAGLWSGPVRAFISVPPPVVSLSLTYGSETTVTLSGQVTDLDASSLAVTFTGVVSGSVAVNSDGTFSLTTTATGLGTIQASTTDLWGQASNTAQVTVSASPPSITSFTAI